MPLQAGGQLLTAMTQPADTAAREARALYARRSEGVLSTISLDVPGYPFGSIVPYAADARGQPVILISGIAQHTRNILADHRVSLTLAEDADDAQAAGRVTILGDARAVPAEEVEAVKARYERRFPSSAAYHAQHDFAFFRIEPVRVRYIGGFGRIHWVEADAFCHANPFAGASETGMVQHMNDDHVDALRDYCRLYNFRCEDRDTPRVTGIDAEGFELRVGKRLLRIDFDRPAETAKDVRMAMVALAQRARAPAGTPA